MANINKIEVFVLTRKEDAGGTDDNVFLGLGGREFRLDTALNDFESPSDPTFVLGGGGVGSNVENEDENDPRNPGIDTEDLAAFPVYLRKAGTVDDKDGGDDAWMRVAQVRATVNPGPDQIVYRREFRRGLRLSNETGLVIYLKPDQENVGERREIGSRTLTVTATVVG